MNQIVTTTQAPLPIIELEAMASHIVKSGLFGMKRQEEAVALMIVAQAEGRHPGTVASEYHIIQGRPALKADAILARFQSAGGKVEWKDYTDTKVSGTFSHPAGGSLYVEWDMERAKAAGLGGKDNWKKYPRQMLRARVVSDAVRGVYPAVLQGFYTPEEVQDFGPVAVSATPVIEDKPKLVKKAKEVAPVIEAEVVDTTPEPAEDKSWVEPMEASLGAEEVAVNAFLATKGQIDAGQTWRDLPDNAYRQRIIANPEGFVKAATATKE
jgi:hypothetical protein